MALAVASRPDRTVALAHPQSIGSRLVGVRLLVGILVDDLERAHHAVIFVF